MCTYILVQAVLDVTREEERRFTLSPVGCVEHEFRLIQLAFIGILLVSLGHSLDSLLEVIVRAVVRRILRQVREESLLHLLARLELEHVRGDTRVVVGRGGVGLVHGILLGGRRHLALLIVLDLLHVCFNLHKKVTASKKVKATKL